MSPDFEDNRGWQALLRSRLPSCFPALRNEFLAPFLPRPLAFGFINWLPGTLLAYV